MNLYKWKFKTLVKYYQWKRNTYLTCRNWLYWHVPIYQRWFLWNKRRKALRALRKGIKKHGPDILKWPGIYIHFREKD